MYIGSFELTVMFSGITNSPATFQAMMNEILRDLINKEKVAAFVDNVLVGTETEENCGRNIEEVRRERLVYQAREMYVKGKEDRIPRSCHRTRWNRNGSRESRWST